MQIILFLVVFAAAVTLALYLASRWASALFTKELTGYLSAGESIVNHERIPDAWLLSYRKRSAAMRQAGKSERKIEAVGLSAQTHCLHEFDKLIHFFERNNLTDGDETRADVLTALRTQRDLCERASWQALLAPDSALSAAADEEMAG